MGIIDDVVADLKKRIAALEAAEKEHVKALDSIGEDLIILRAMLAQGMPGGDNNEMPDAVHVPKAWKDSDFTHGSRLTPHQQDVNDARSGMGPLAQVVKPAEYAKHAPEPGHKELSVVIEKAPRVKDAAELALDFLVEHDEKGGATVTNLALYLYDSSSQKAKANAANRLALLKREGHAMNHVRGLWRASPAAIARAKKAALTSRSAHVGKGA